MDSPKYNRTFHVPWSPGGTSDDKIAPSVSSLLNIPIIITEKVDGSNTCMEEKQCFARTHSGPPSHTSFDAFKAMHAAVSNRIIREVQIFGEWCYALHSIPYDKLPGYFLTFAVRNIEQMIWLEWDAVELWADELGVPTVPVLFKGEVKTESELREITESLAAQPSLLGTIREGVVIRAVNGFSDDDFSKNVMKWVRKNHVQTSEHWKEQNIIKNKLRP